MLFPERMYEVSIIVHKHYFDTLLMELHENGWLQIFDYNKSKFFEARSVNSAEQPTKRTEALSELILNLNRLREILKKTEVAPPGLYQSLKSYKPPRPTPINLRPVAEQISDARKTLRTLNFIYELDTEISSKTSAVNNLKLQLEKVRLFERTNINLNSLTGTQDIAIILGRTNRPDELNLELQSALSRDVMQRKEFALYFQGVPEGLEGYITIIIVPKIELNNIRKVLVGRYFKELELSRLEGTPDRVVKNLKSEIHGLENDLTNLKSDLRTAYNKHFQMLSIILEELELARKKTQIHAMFGETSSSTIICGWCLKRQIRPLAALCEEVTGGHVSMSYKEPDEKQYKEVPIQLKNPKWAKPFEMLTKTFAYPKYNEIDPTVIIAPLFILFFAIMLGDAGYGILLLSISIFGFVKFGKTSKTIKNLSLLGIYAGASTIIVGIIMGAFFGDLIPRFIYKNPDALLYSVNIAGISLPYDSFKNPMILFTISLLIGLFIINLGFALGAVQNIMKRSFKDLITIQVAWFIIQPPAILIIGHYLLKIWTLSQGLLIISMIFLVVGIVLLRFKYKSLTAFELTGYMGDWLSFARLLALSLATMGMALTFNIMGELVLNMGSSAVTFAFTAVIASILLVFVHLINLGLQTLGAAIHSLRLQYIELFNRCYEGGGTSFKPFYTGRAYTKLKRTK